MEGGTVTFKIGPRIVATGIWHSGGNDHLNIHPPAANAGGPYSGVVGVAVPVTASASDWGTDIATYAWDWDNDSTYDATGAAQSHTWSTVGVKTVGLKVTDIQGGEGTKTVSVTIGKGTAVVTLDSLSQTWNDTPRPATATTVPPGLSVSFTYDGSASPPILPGSYAVVATVNDANYAGTASGTLVINKALATVNLSGLSQVYSGSGKEATVTTVPNGLVVNVTYNGLSTLPIAIGDYSVVATVVDTLYQGSKTGTLHIAAAEATITLGNLAQTYDGSPHPVSVVTTPPGLSYSITYGGSGTAPTNAGSYEVVATITDPNYSGSRTDTLVIDKATSTTLVSGGGSFTYDGSAHAATVSVTGAGGLSLTPAPSYSGACTTAPVNVANTPCNASYTYAGDANHYGSTDTKVITITKAAASVVLSGLSFTYTGSQHAVTVTTNPTSLSNTVTYDGVATVPTNAGTYAVVATITDPNYSGSASGSLIISKAAASIVSINNQNQMYDGTPKPVTVTTNPANIVAVTVTYNGSTIAPSATGSYPLVASITDPNYTGSDAVGTLEIRATYGVTLYPGWNLISFPLLPKPSDAPADVLSGISGNYDLVYGWDASGGHSGGGNWMKYDPKVGYGDSLTKMDHTNGYWIHVTASTNITLNVVGFMPTSTSMILSTPAQGWNLVGYPSIVGRSLPGVLTEHTTRVYAYHLAEPADPWKLFDRAAPVYSNDLTNLQPGWGYWMYLTAEDVWDITY